MLLMCFTTLSFHDERAWEPPQGWCGLAPSMYKGASRTYIFLGGRLKSDHFCCEERSAMYSRLDLTVIREALEPSRRSING
jgi:hypothetical protein